MARQGQIRRMPCPRVGARMGMIMNTMNVNDMTRAIDLPEYMSRITDRTTTAHAAARPLTRRATNSISKFRVSAHASAAMP